MQSSKTCVKLLKNSQQKRKAMQQFLHGVVVCMHALSLNRININFQWYCAIEKGFYGHAWGTCDENKQKVFQNIRTLVALII